MKLSDFLNERKFASIANINESIRSRDIDKAITLIKSYLGKRGIYTMPVVLTQVINNKRKFSVNGFNKNNYGVCFNWDLADSASIESVLFTRDYDAAMVAWVNGNDYTWDVKVECKGASIVRICRMVEDVMDGKVPMTTSGINSLLKDAQLWEGSEEFLTPEQVMIDEVLVTEASDDPYIENLKKKKDTLYRKIRNMNKSGKDTTELQKQYDELAAELKDARLNVSGNVKTSLKKDEDVERYQEQFEEEERATPEERFKDMESYIFNVIMGIRPLAIICGAPGVGKTFRIMKAIKSTGKEHGTDYGLIKGKSTAANFYMMLHDYKEEGQLIVCDDADELVKDDVAINLIKAAMDSSDERWVTYGTSRPPLMSEERAMMCDDAVTGPDGKYYYPKEFETHGGMIIITNMGAGMIDTAIKNRALICDLNFTTDEVLEIVRGIAPKIKPGVLSDYAKEKALDYLQELADKKVPMEISIRSFTLVAGMFMSDAPERDIQRRIREQMRLQFTREKKKY